MLQVEHASAIQIAQEFGGEHDMPIYAIIGRDGGEVVAAAGLGWYDGVCWLWYVVRGEKRYPMAVKSWTKKLLKKAKQFGADSVYTLRDTEYETSERLLGLMGFQYMEELSGSEVWKWPKLQQ